MVLSFIYVMYFPINLCGVEDSVENYQAYLISCCPVVVFESYYILFFFSFCYSYLDLSYDFYALLCFHLQCFSLCILLLAVEMSDMQAF